MAGRAEKLTVSGQPALATTSDVEFPATTLRCRTITLVLGRRGIQLMLSGVPANMKAASAQVEAAIRGLELDPGLEAVRKTGNAVRDLRLGFFSRGPTAKHRFTDATPPSIRPVASLHQWKAGRDEFVVLAICAIQEGQDAEWFEEMLSRTFLRQIKVRIGIQGDPERRKTRLGDQEATLLRWKGRTGNADVLYCRRDNTFYALISLSRTTDLAKIGESFGFLD
jgi:hypothetical protein